MRGIIYFIYTLILPFGWILDALERPKLENIYPRKQFELLYKKVVFLNKNKTHYKVNSIFEKAWDTLQKKVRKNIEFTFWQFIPLLILFFIFLFLVLLANNSVIDPVNLEKNNSFKIFQMTIYGSLSLTFLTLAFCCLFKYIILVKKIKKVDDILKKWTFAKDSLYFDKTYVAENTIIDNLYIEIKRNNNLFKVRKNDFEKIWFFELSRGAQTDQEAFLISYLLIWGMHYNLDFVKNTNYKEIYQNFVNLYQKQINELSNK